MIKLMVAALWISIATTGAVLYSFQSAQAPEEEAAADKEPDAFGGLDYVKTGIISVPVFDEGRVHGYFLARLVFTAERERLAQLKLPAEALISDQVYTHLFANPEIDFTEQDNLDLDAFREGIRAGVNERLGEEFVREVLVEQVDFLSKDEVQKTSLQNTHSAFSPAPVAAENNAGGH